MSKNRTCVICACLSLIWIASCKSTPTVNYQKDRDVENRDTYSNVEGMMQYQKDQLYLIEHEVNKKCLRKKIDNLVEAHLHNYREAFPLKTKLLEPCD
jgi:hypothetical protein